MSQLTGCAYTILRMAGMPAYKPETLTEDEHRKIVNEKIGCPFIPEKGERVCTPDCSISNSTKQYICDCTEYSTDECRARWVINIATLKENKSGCPYAEDPHETPYGSYTPRSCSANCKFDYKYGAYICPCEEHVFPSVYGRFPACVGPSGELVLPK